MALNFLFACLFATGFVFTSPDVRTSSPILVVTLSLVPFTVNGHPIPFPNEDLLDMFDSRDSSPLTTSPPEVVALSVVVAGPSLAMRSVSVSTEQSNTTSTDSQPVQSMGLDNHGTMDKGSISPRTIITIVFSLFVFFVTFVVLYLWRVYYPPRPGRLPIANRPGVDSFQTGSTISTVPLPAAAVKIRHSWSWLHVFRLSTNLALFISSQVALYYTVRWVLDGLNPEKKQNVNTKKLEALKRLGHSSLKLDEYERTVANEVIHPDDINVRFSDIGGLDPIISSLRESIIYPLLYPNLFSTSSLLGAPKGVLLFGPPGCGKTMLAKALAKESGATFINIAASVLTNKWYGESNKLVAGLFSLARKTQPSIIFIDEIDSFLRERTKGDHEVTGMMKAEFMTLWDGLLSASDRILVLGATNRPNDIDAAILRRMPKRFAIQLPDYDQRLKILTLMLKDTKISSDFSMGALAAQSEGFSGSDLKEICRNAAMVPVREYLRNAANQPELLEKGQVE
ncbi:hypothetical protein C0993_007060, partial [Termitomyces sp. T159_Od127]